MREYFHTVEMSAEASEFLKRVAGLYEAAQRPDHRAWYFDAGLTEAVHLELAAAGVLMKVLGTERGYAWRLTDAGLAAVL